MDNFVSIATGTYVKCYSPKSFPSFKASLELSFSRIMHAHMVQRLFETSVPTHATPSLACLFAGYVAYRARVGLVGRRLARDSRPAASKDELLLRIQAI
ncbi:uncharacterized protein TNCV_2948021 [Trichonephila clavipes]|nr:uncharacterized protein TNCV_2948021 [Trichonephila clavipes]